LVKLRTALKNKVNNILSAHGINVEKEALSSEKKLTEMLAITRPYGSARGAISNGRPYRDSNPCDVLTAYSYRENHQAAANRR
jgi:hypothetical protein